MSPGDSFPLIRRRKFLLGSLAFGAGILFPLPPLLAKERKKEENAEVGPAEDLMREHGALNRILLVYEEGLHRLRADADLKPQVLRKAASLIHTFIESYHEKLEEEFVFPRLRSAGKLGELAEVLERQHREGRKLTAAIEQLARQSALRDENARHRFGSAIEAFVRMYRPHEAREDTVIFPEFHRLLSPREYDALGEKFEERETELLGRNGFEHIIEQIVELEKSYGIHDLAKFTPTG